MSYEVRIRSNFSAAHALRRYEGPCERRHGHNFAVVAIVACKNVGDIGIAIDFKVLRHIIDNILDKLDHQDLNEIPPFDNINPTAENLAAFIYQLASPDVLALGATLKSVTVEESDKYAATYGPEI